MIKQATSFDKKEAAPLIYDANLDIAHHLTGEKEVSDVIIKLEDFFSEKGNRLSYENCLVKEIDGKVVGIAISYYGKDASNLDEPIKQFLRKKTGKELTIEKEADETDYYIDSLSVHPNFRNQRIGTELLKASIQRAKDKGYSTVALVVEENNVKAKKLYEQLGFNYKKTITLQNHRYHYLYLCVW